MTEIPERVKTRTQLVEEAIVAALEADWKGALALNLEVSERFGADEEVNNRLGKAYTELGRLDNALAAYRATLELNPLNGIAIKNSNRLQALIEEKAEVPRPQAALDVNLFVEETGKTALAALRLDAGIDAALVAPGEQVELVPTGDSLRVSASGVPLGHVESKIARRVLKFMAGGNQYAAAVASSDDKGVKLIIRETVQAPQFAGQASFPTRKATDFRAYAKDSLLRDADGDGASDDDADIDAGDVDADEDLEGMHAVDPAADDSDDYGDEERKEDGY